MTDKIEYIGKTVIQHGKGNNRVYLMKLDMLSDKLQIIDYIGKLCREEGYTKSFVKIRASDFPLFFLRGYRMEAYIPDFFRNNDDCIFACRYFSEERALFAEIENGENLVSLLAVNENKRGKRKADKFSEQKAVESDAEQLAGFYSSSFPNYPFPLSDSEYVLKTMKSNVDYFIIRDKGRIIAASSAEIDSSEINAEMTDFAVNPEYRGAGLAGMLLAVMEKHLKTGPVKTLYTIARLNSPAMNAVFMKSSYKYSGTLVNNTNISTGIESMNVWYKHIT